jgi:hypothetical protein
MTPQESMQKARPLRLKCPPMTNAESDPELHQDLLKIVVRQREVTATIQPALDAMEEGMAALRTVCSLIADKSQMKRSYRICAFAGQPWQHSIAPNAGYKVIIVSKRICKRLRRR